MDDRGDEDASRIARNARKVRLERLERDLDAHLPEFRGQVERAVDLEPGQEHPDGLP